MTKTDGMINDIELVVNEENQAQSLNVYLCLNRFSIGSVLVETINMTDDDRVKFYQELGCDNFKASDNRLLIKLKSTDLLTVEEVEELTVTQLGDIIYKFGYLPMMRLCYTHDQELLEALAVEDQPLSNE